MISYEKLRVLCKKNGITSYTIKKNNIVSQSTWIAIQNDKDIRVSAINELCKFLDVQPADILEYIPDEE